MAYGSSGGKLTVWSLTTERKLREITTNEKYAKGIWRVAFSPTHGWLAVSRDPGHVTMWDWTTGEMIHEWDRGAAVFDVAFSPDGNILASTSDEGTVQLTHVAGPFKGHQVELVVGHHEYSAAFSADGQTIITGGTNHTVTIWDVSTAETRTTLAGHTDVVYTVAFSPDGRLIASGSADGEIRLWRAATDEEVENQWMSSD